MVTVEMSIHKENAYVDKDMGKKFSRTPLYRQIFVCSGVTSYCFIYGLFLGAPTVYFPKIRREANSTEAINMSTAPWLSSVGSCGAEPWIVVMTVLAQCYGRKIPYIILCLTTVGANLLFYFSTSFVKLIISGIFQNVLFAVVVTLSVMTLTEYTSPSYRGFFMTFQSATIYSGIWVSNVMETYFHWRNISILIFICCVFNISAFFWPESPYWLATKGRFRECVMCHTWLKGDNNASRKELKDLISSQKIKFDKKSQYDTINKPNIIMTLYKILTCENFYKPFFYAMLTVCLYYSTGKLACTVYAIDIIKKITDSESTAYQGMLILDGISVLGMYIGCILSTFLKRRTLLLVSSSIGVSFLFNLSLYLYLIKLNIISENKYLSIILLILFSVTLSSGPMIMCMCLSGELAPLKYRNLYLITFGLLTNATMATSLRIAPYIFYSFNTHGTFLFYGITASVFLVILYKYVPETKDKTLYEIQRFIVGNEHVLNTENEIISNTIVPLQDHSDTDNFLEE